MPPPPSNQDIWTGSKGGLIRGSPVACSLDVEGGLNCLHAGYQLSEASSVPCPPGVGGPVQPGAGAPQHAAVCLRLPLPARCLQPQTKVWSPLHAPGQ